jgi:hypothetical protein
MKTASWPGLRPHWGRKISYVFFFFDDTIVGKKRRCPWQDAATTEATRGEKRPTGSRSRKRSGSVASQRAAKGKRGRRKLKKGRKGKKGKRGEKGNR